MAVVEDWRRWAIKGMDGFAGHLRNDIRENGPLNEDQRRTVASIILRLKEILDASQPRTPEG